VGVVRGEWTSEIAEQRNAAFSTDGSCAEALGESAKLMDIASIRPSMGVFDFFMMFPFYFMFAY
jgi:hypothetical protein